MSWLFRSGKIDPLKHEQATDGETALARTPVAQVLSLESEEVLRSEEEHEDRRYSNENRL
jgi:hypothetical protein